MKSVPLILSKALKESSREEIEVNGQTDSHLYLNKSLWF